MLSSYTLRSGPSNLFDSSSFKVQKFKISIEAYFVESKLLKRQIGKDFVFLSDFNDHISNFSFLKSVSSFILTYLNTIQSIFLKVLSNVKLVLHSRLSFTLNYSFQMHIRLNIKRIVCIHVKNKT